MGRNKSLSCLAKKFSSPLGRGEPASSLPQPVELEEPAPTLLQQKLRQLNPSALWMQSVRLESGDSIHATMELNGEVIGFYSYTAV